ncbi:MAG TPA: class I SAM-dependent methyltransferase [Chloroflexia bacterium]|nr:class I SAM-dependent methyltransferase [Chloroflexia bacterium]
MEYIRGKSCAQIEGLSFSALASTYDDVLVDLGTGDGRYVQAVAQAYSRKLVIGLDACRENLYKLSAKSLPNTLYLIVNAENLPPELAGMANTVTVNFPWGSLLTGLLQRRSGVLDGLQMLLRPGGNLRIILNSSALVQANISPEQAALSIQANLREYGFRVGPVQKLEAKELRVYPSTWAKRLAYGRDPQALLLIAKKEDSKY